MRKTGNFKSTLIAFLTICLLPVCSVCAQAASRTVAYHSFDTEQLIRKSESRFTIGSLSGYYEYMLPGQLRFLGPAFGRMEKSVEDGAFCAVYLEKESVSDHADWANVMLSESFAESVKAGEKVHFSLEFANETNLSSLVAKIGINGEFGKYSYQPIFPVSSNGSYTGDAWAIRYADWIYYVGLYDLVGAHCENREWYRMDVVVDTKNEEYGGIQTIAFYLNGELKHLGKFDANADTSQTELISTLSGLRLQLSPKVEKRSNTEELYHGYPDQSYVDNVVLEILSPDDEVILPQIDGKPYSGGYSAGSRLSYNQKLPGAMALIKAGEGNTAEYRVAHADAEGMIQMELPDDIPLMLYLWDQGSLAPLSVARRLMPYHETLVLDADFSEMGESGLPDGVFIVSGKASQNVVKHQAVERVFGKNEHALQISNIAGSAATATATELETGVRMGVSHAPLEVGDALTISFDYAQDGGQYTKTIVPKAINGVMRELATINPAGEVRIFGNLCRNEKQAFALNDRQWYHFDIVLNTDFLGNINAFSAYINGKQYFENIPFSYKKTVEHGFLGISNVTVSYNLAEYMAPDATSTEFSEDGFYIANFKIRTTQGCLPKLDAVCVKSSDAVFGMMIDNDRFMIEDYGQDAATFLGTLTGEGTKTAELLDAQGAPLKELIGDGGGYCSVETTNGYTIYYAVQKGSNPELWENIDPALDKNPDTTGWYAYKQPDANLILKPDNILNLSTTGKEVAGARGFIRADGENFICSGDQSRIQFWGCNVIGEACFPEHAEAEKMADLIAANGMNLVRFHQLGGRGNLIFGTSQDASRLDVAQMEKLCYFLRELRERGIYYYIDLGRILYESDQLEFLPNDADLALYFDETIQQLQITYAKMLMTYPDPYDNNSRICDNPALMGVQCVNESFAFGDELEAKETPEVAEYYYGILDALFTAWVKEKYSNDWRLNLSHRGYLHSGESVNGTIHLEKHAERNANIDQRNMDILQFLTELQQEYFAKMQAMFAENNIQTLMTGSTQFGMMEPTQMAANHDMDFLDLHTYWAHPDGFSLDTGIVLGSDYSKIDSMLKDENLGIIGTIVNRKPNDMPFTISEWNACASSLYMAEGPLLMAAFSKMHNWNPMHFLFAYQGIENYPDVRISDVFTMAENPILLATMPAATMVYQNVHEATTQYYNDYSATNPWEFRKHSIDGVGMWYNYDMFSSVPDTGLICKSGVAMFTSPKNSEGVLEKVTAAKQSGVYVSETEELTYNKNQKSFSVNTGKSKAVAGFFGGESIAVGDAEFCFDNEFAVAYINSKTDAPIAESKRILLTVSGKAVNSNQVVSRDGLKVLQQGKTPVLVEQITGKVRIKTNADRIVYALDSSGQRKQQVKTTYQNGILTIPLSLADQSANYEIVEK